MVRVYVSFLFFFIDKTYRNYFCKKKFFKVKIDKILPKINYATRTLNGLLILSLKN